MTSLKQIEANRHNALKSTGPKTPEGKESSRCNAVRHGLTAETVLVNLENSADYQLFEEAVISDYNSETAVQLQLILRLVGVLWRLRRATSIETAIFDSETEKVRPLCKAKSIAANFDKKSAMADAFLRLSAMQSLPLDRLSRYEYMLWRQARQIISTLEPPRRRARAPSRISFPFQFNRGEEIR